MRYTLLLHGDQWIVVDENGGESLVRKFRFDIINLLWRMVEREHITGVNVHGVNSDGDEVIVSLFKQENDIESYDRFTFASRRDRVTLAGFFWVLADPGYKKSFNPLPIPKSKRPTSKKAVANDWEYTTPIAARA